MGLVTHLCRDLEALPVQIANLRQHGVDRHAALVVRQAGRIADIGKNPIGAAHDDHDHEHVSQGMNVPAKLESAVQGGDDEERRSQIHMARQPPGHLTELRVILAFADPVPQEPQDQTGPDGAQRIAQPRAPVGTVRRIVERVGQDREYDEPQAELEIEKLAVSQKRLVHRSSPGSSLGPVERRAACHRQELFRAHAYRRARGTGPHAGGTPG